MPSESQPTDSTNAVPARRPLPRHLPTVLLVAIGVLASLWVFQIATQADEQEAQQEYERQARERIHQIELEAARKLAVARSIGALYDSSQHVDRDEFRAFAKYQLSQDPNLLSVEWAPRVTADAVGEFAERARADGVEFGITRLDDAGKLVPSEAEAVQYPVYYAEPDRDGIDIIGFDLASDASRRTAIEAAVRSGTVATTTSVDLIQASDQGAVLGLVILQPVYQKGATLQSPEQRERAIQGLATVVVRIADLVDAGSIEGTPSALQVTLIDPDDDRVLFSPPGQGSTGADTVVEGNVAVGARTWLVRVAPSGPIEGSNSPLLVLLAGLSFTGLLGAFVGVMLNRKAVVERVVKERTEELSNTMEKLMHSDRLAAAGQLASGVAHEVMNPANFVMANLESMRGHLVRMSGFVEASQHCLRLPDEGARRTAYASALDEYDVVFGTEDSAELITESLDGMQRIVSIAKDLGTFSRADQGTVDWVQVNDVAKVACNMVRNQIKQRARLVTDYGDVPEILADRGKLTQLVTNLLVNAVHATPEGDAENNRITVKTSVKGDKVVITVRDTGKGMPKEVRDHVFEPFYTTKDVGEGTGLGLSLASEIVARHRGEIEVDSEVGKGTRFDVIIPRETGLEAPAHAKRKPMSKEVPTRHLARQRVLMIDDEASLLSAYQRMIKSSHRLVCVESGEKALDLLEKDATFDVVFCDLMMPGIDGRAVYEAIQASHPELVERIVFCSAGAFTPRAREFIATVPNLCLEKPVNQEDLQRAIQQICADD